jgi:hypothetical protein
MRAPLTAALSLLLVGLGIAILVETAIVGGGIGYLFGVLFVLAGALRLYVTRRR